MMMITLTHSFYIVKIGQVVKSDTNLFSPLNIKRIYSKKESLNPLKQKVRRKLNQKKYSSHTHKKILFHEIYTCTCT